MLNFYLIVLKYNLIGLISGEYGDVYIILIPLDSIFLKKYLDECELKLSIRKYVLLEKLWSSLYKLLIS